MRERDPPCCVAFSGVIKLYPKVSIIVSVVYV